MDDFEAFRRKKDADRAAKLAAEAAAKGAGIEEEPGRPKGFRRGRVAKPKQPVQGIVPKGLQTFSGVEGTLDPASLAKPKGFDLGRADLDPLKPGEALKPKGLDTGRFDTTLEKPPDAAPPKGFRPTRFESKPIDPQDLPKPKGLKRY